MPLSNFPNGVSSFGVPVLGGINGTPLTGTWYFVDPAAGSDGYDGKSPDFPFATLYQAHAKCVAGNNDVVVLIGNGASSGTARLSTALAQTIDSTVTTGTLVWSKNATHLIGVCAPTVVGQRARIAPPTGTYTASTFGSDIFVNVTAAGCYFSNFDVYSGFSTGSATFNTWRDAGGRNYYGNVNLQGLADAASAGGAGARNLLITGTGENTFDGCVIGLDTVTRSAANASVEFAAAVPRNTFRNCIFPFMTSAATPLGIIGTGAACMDRWHLFDNCKFINNVQSTSTTMSALATLPASAGGLILATNSTLVGITEWGTDVTSRGQIYVDGGTVTAATSGIAVNPT